ncbi:MAG TPA: cytochrome c [Terriglobales bacterium]|jgi:mono/diheme cytochrome c family protein|nr:cytochrome c [Terriglobales bacterium]
MLKRNVLLLAVLMGWAMFSIAQQKEIKHVPVKPTSAASGEEMYNTYCAVCHGKDGKGGGPAADALKVPPTDLTTLAKKNGGKYPSDHVSAAIQGDLNLPAHGSKEMPIWGNLFWHMSGGHQSEVQLRVANLNKYIESLQAK